MKEVLLLASETSCDGLISCCAMMLECVQRIDSASLQCLPLPTLKEYSFIEKLMTSINGEKLTVQL
jgi:hypothetical protein